MTHKQLVLVMAKLASNIEQDRDEDRQAWYGVHMMQVYVWWKARIGGEASEMRIEFSLEDSNA